MYLSVYAPTNFCTVLCLSRYLLSIGLHSYLSNVSFYPTPPSLRICLLSNLSIFLIVVQCKLSIYVSIHIVPACVCVCFLPVY